MSEIEKRIRDMKESLNPLKEFSNVIFIDLIIFSSNLLLSSQELFKATTTKIHPNDAFYASLLNAIVSLREIVATI